MRRLEMLPFCHVDASDLWPYENEEQLLSTPLTGTFISSILKFMILSLMIYF